MGNALHAKSRSFLILVAALERDDWNNRNFGTLGTDVSLIRLERSEAVEPSIGLRAGYLERLERDPFLVSIRDHTCREG
jgi:hypothetical protein